MKLPRLQVIALLIKPLCHTPIFAVWDPVIWARRQPGAAGAGAFLTLPKAEGPVVVRAAFHLRDINEIDEEAETFQFSGVLTLVWQDSRRPLIRDRRGSGADLPGCLSVRRNSPAWYPQVLLANVSGMYETPAVLLSVKPDGTCRLVMAVNAVAESKLNLRRCPFDGQRLDAVFEVFGFNASEVLLEPEPIGDPIDGRGAGPAMDAG